MGQIVSGTIDRIVKNGTARLVNKGLERLSPLADRSRRFGDGVSRFGDGVSRFGDGVSRFGDGVSRVYERVKGVRNKDSEPENEVNIVDFDNVTKYYRTKNGIKTILRNADFRVARGKSLAVLGQNGSGKSTLFRLLAGVEQPTEGSITRGVRVSWPLGFGGGFNADISARENCIFVSRIYETDVEDVIRFVRGFSELGNYFDMPVKTYSSGMRARLAFGLSMAVNFECYLIDEITAVGDKRFKEKCREAFRDRRETADVIMISHSVSTIRSYCDVAAVLNNGKLIFYEDLDEAINVYKSL